MCKEMAKTTENYLILSDSSLDNTRTKDSAMAQAEKMNIIIRYIKINNITRMVRIGDMSRLSLPDSGLISSK